MVVSKPAMMIATLGGQAQVITFALDALLARGVTISELIVLHLDDPAGRTRRALAQLSTEFTDDCYQGQRLRFRPFPIRIGREIMVDIYDEVDSNAVWEVVHGLIADLKRGQHTLHVCISGGRRILGLLTMSAAMLHFGHQDTLWHMYTPDELRRQSRDGTMMHLPADCGFRLIRVPMMPWGSYFPVLRQLARPEGDVADVLAGPRELMDAGERTRCASVLAQLTGRQEAVLRAFAQGCSPQEVAERLHITLKTVDSHKTVILKECRNAWVLPPDGWLDYHFLREKFGDFYR